jgi:hypothetical protein
MSSLEKVEPKAKVFKPDQRNFTFPHFLFSTAGVKTALIFTSIHVSVTDGLFVTGLAFLASFLMIRYAVWNFKLSSDTPSEI